MGMDFVATAHTASDQAETLMMRLVRGTALQGASSIRRVRRQVVRPLLDWTREEVEAYLQAKGHSYVRDPMNADLTYLRVRMRRQVLPTLERAAGFPVAKKLAQFAQVAAEDDALLRTWAKAHFERLSMEGGQSLDAIGTRALAKPLRRRVVARFLRSHHLAVDRFHIEGALQTLETGIAFPMSGDQTLRLRKGRLTFTSNPPRRVAGVLPQAALGPGRRKRSRD
jgi:tRNA(Ile)-lysidine synthase